MCLVLLSTSVTALAQQSHSYGMDSEIPELHCHLHTAGLFCIGHNFETIISRDCEMLGTPTQCHTLVIYDDTGQKTRLNSILLTPTSITTEIGPLKFGLAPAQTFNVDSGSGSCSGSNLKIDSGSCSGLKCKLQQESTPALRLSDNL